MTPLLIEESPWNVSTNMEKGCHPSQGDNKPPSTSDEEGGIINAASDNYRDTRDTDCKDDTWKEVMRLKQIASGLAVPCQRK